MAITGVQLGGGTLIVAPSTTLAFDGTVTTSAETEVVTNVATGIQAAIDGILVPSEEYYALQGGNDSVDFDPIFGSSSIVLTGIGIVNASTGTLAIATATSNILALTTTANGQTSNFSVVTATADINVVTLNVSNQVTIASSSAIADANAVTTSVSTTINISAATANTIAVALQVDSNVTVSVAASASADSYNVTNITFAAPDIVVNTASSAAPQAIGTAAGASIGYVPLLLASADSLGVGVSASVSIAIGLSIASATSPSLSYTISENINIVSTSATAASPNATASVGVSRVISLVTATSAAPAVVGVYLGASVAIPVNSVIATNPNVSLDVSSQIAVDINVATTFFNAVENKVDVLKPISVNVSSTDALAIQGINRSVLVYFPEQITIVFSARQPTLIATSNVSISAFSASSDLKSTIARVDVIFNISSNIATATYLTNNISISSNQALNVFTAIATKLDAPVSVDKQLGIATLTSLAATPNIFATVSVSPNIATNMCYINTIDATFLANASNVINQNSVNALLNNLSSISSPNANIDANTAVANLYEPSENHDTQVQIIHAQASATNYNVSVTLGTETLITTNSATALSSGITATNGELQILHDIASLLVQSYANNSDISAIVSRVYRRTGDITSNLDQLPGSPYQKLADITSNLSITFNGGYTMSVDILTTISAPADGNYVTLGDIGMPIGLDYIQQNDIKSILIF